MWPSPLALCLSALFAQPAALLLRQPPAPAPAPRAQASPPFDVRADRMEFDQKKRTVLFEGQVRAQRPDLTLQCARLRATLDDKGAVQQLTAEGPVQVTLKEATLSAGRAHYDPHSGRLELTERPTVRRGDDLLKAARVLVWPETGRLVMEQITGTVSAPALEGFKLQMPPTRSGPP